MSTYTDVLRYRELFGSLFRRDLEAKYKGTALGVLWSLANPLVMVGIYTFAFTKIMPVGSPQFVFYLLLGLLAWTFFASSVAMSTSAIADNGGLLKSVWFPRAILPTATVLFNLVGWTYVHMRTGHGWTPEHARAAVLDPVLNGLLALDRERVA